MCVSFFLTGDNSYLSTVQIIDSLGLRRVQVDCGGSGGCAGLPEIYRDSSIPRGERGKYANRVGRTVYIKSQLSVKVCGPLVRKIELGKLYEDNNFLQVFMF